MRTILKIGDVAKLCNISIKTLRYYEEMGLIKPVEVDIYSGYRYYDEKNIEEIYKIQFLKEIGLALKDIRDFDDHSLTVRMKEISKEIRALKKQKKLINSLINLKGEKIMKPFINDEKAIGKWKYIASALSKEQYLEGDMIQDIDILFKEIYFLPNGQGYWVFERWSKGEMYHYRGVVYTYEIEDDKLYLSIMNCQTNEFEIVCVYEKVDSKEYTVDEIRRKDDINLPFVNDKDAVGFWEAYDFIDNPESFNPEQKEDDQFLLFKKISLDPLGNVNIIYNNDNHGEKKWTKGYILDSERVTASKYVIKTFGDDDYLIMEWKSGDYSFGGQIFGHYVFKKIK